MKFLKVFACCFLLMLNLSSKYTYAQTCKGSLGSAVVNITFGAGIPAEIPLPSGVTTYSYSVASCPNDGFYNIASRSISCFNQTWHSVVEDHTPGDVNGNMMVINASFQTGDFYKQTVSGLCGGTTYEFSAWILNILKTNSCGSAGIDPNITFNIEDAAGTVIGSYNTGNITETENPKWEQYGFYFTAPPNLNSFVIRMTNNSIGGCGNDLALDDITFRACGPAIVAKSLTSLTSNKLCAGKSGTVNLTAAVSSGYNDPVFQWQINSNDNLGWNDIAGATQTSYQFNIASANKDGYQFRLAVAERLNINSPNCRILSEVVKAEITADPVASAGDDLTIIEGNAVTLNGKAIGDNLRYYWTPPSYLDNPNLLNPIANPPEDITYTLNVISQDCNQSATDQIFIRVLKNLIIPNAFTPNGDLKNDLWNIIALNTYFNASILVYNRYGQTVFKSTGYARQWDGTFEGKPLPVGAYFYMIDLKTESPVLKGVISIMR